MSHFTEMKINFSQENEAELDRLSNIIKSFNDQFGTLFKDADRVVRRLKDDIAPKVAADPAYQNAKQNTPKTARSEHDKALAKVMLDVLKDDTEVYKQFVQNPSFKRFVTDMVFCLTIGTNEQPGNPPCAWGRQAPTLLVKSSIDSGKRSAIARRRVLGCSLSDWFRRVRSGTFGVRGLRSSGTLREHGSSSSTRLPTRTGLTPARTQFSMSRANVACGPPQSGLPATTCNLVQVIPIQNFLNSDHNKVGDIVLCVVNDCQYLHLNRSRKCTDYFFQE